MSVNGQRIGYIRVSSYDQNADRQLEQVAVDRVFMEKCSGKDMSRPQLQAMLDYAREGDTIVIHSMDRLARNVDDLRRIVQSQNRRGVTVQFVKENLVFTGEDLPMANLSCRSWAQSLNSSVTLFENVSGKGSLWPSSVESIAGGRNRSHPSGRKSC